MIFLRDFSQNEDIPRSRERGPVEACGEGADDIDAPGHGAITVKNGRGHDRPVLGEYAQ